VLANFESSMVRRAIPDAWNFANPSDLTTIRATAAATALRRIVPDVERLALQVNSLLESVVAAGQPIGRPLFAANRTIHRLHDPVERFRENCTTLREHRGDGHVVALAAAGIAGAERALEARELLNRGAITDNRVESAPGDHPYRVDLCLDDLRVIVGPTVGGGEPLPSATHGRTAASRRLDGVMAF
jgi:hypothetical protein